MGNAHRWVRRLGAAAMLTASATTAAWAAPVERVRIAPTDVTETDVAQSNAKLAAAKVPLMSMWDDYFRQIGRRFVAPRLLRYRGGAQTACGVMGSGNAGYCAAANAVYFDEVFVA